MKKLLMVLVCVMILVPSAEAWRRGSGFNQGTLHMDKNMISGDATTGLYFDPDNDGTVEFTMGTDGSMTTTGSATMNDLVVYDAAGNATIEIETYHASTGGQSFITLKHSLSDTKDAVVETTTGTKLGQFWARGVNSTPAWSSGGGIISVVQEGAAGADFIPTTMYFETSTNAATNTNQLVLDTDGTVWGDPWNDQRSYQLAGVAYDIGDLSDLCIYAWLTPATSEEDLTSNSHTATYHTMTTADQINKGMVWSLDFDGTDDYLSIADHGDFSFDDAAGANGFTIYGWIEVVASAGSQSILSKWDITTGTELREWFLRIDGDEKLSLEIFDESANVGCSRLTDAALSVGWHFIEVVYNGAGGATAGAGITIYLDGGLVASTATNDGSYVGMEDTASSVFIGAFTTTTGNPSGFYTGDMGLLGMCVDQYTQNEAGMAYLKQRGSYNE